MLGLLQMLQGHWIMIGRLFRNSALPFHVGLSVIIFYGLLEFARFRGPFIDAPHSPVRQLIRSLGAHGLAGCLDHPLRSLMRRHRPLFESFVFATHKNTSKAFDVWTVIRCQAPKSPN